MPHIVAIGGPNGAGKSSAAPALLDELFGIRAFVNADEVAAELGDASSDRVAISAGRSVLQRMRRLAASGADFAFESTLASRSFAPWISTLRGRQNYQFHVIFVSLPSPEMAIARVADRVALGGHDIPVEIVRRRYGRSLRNLFELYIPLAQTWRVYDNSTPRRPQLIAAGGEQMQTEVYDELIFSSLREAVRGSQP